MLAAAATTEVLMAAQRWEEIEFTRVASLCLQRQRKAFLNEALKGKLTPGQEATGKDWTLSELLQLARESEKETLEMRRDVTSSLLQVHCEALQMHSRT